MSSLSVLHSKGKETKTRLFTKPLRGVLGGRIIKVGADDKGKKILEVAKGLEQSYLQLDYPIPLLQE